MSDESETLAQTMLRADLCGFDGRELARVARCLLQTNPGPYGSTASGIMRHIMSRVMSTIPVDHCTYVSTGGWCASGYRLYGDPDGPWCFKVTLTAYGIEKYLGLAEDTAALETYDRMKEETGQ